MVVQVKVTGTGSFQGRSSNITGYSVKESITPIDFSAENGGVGTIDFGATEVEDSVELLDSQITLTDGARGIATGSIRELKSADYGLSVTADSKLILLNVTKTTQPQNGSLLGLVTYYFNLAGITGGFVVEDDVKNKPITVPGMSDTLYSIVSRVCMANGVEMTVIYDNIVIRKIRTNIAVTSRQSTNSISLDRGNPAQSVQIYWYNNTFGTNVTAYPSPLENASSGYQVDSGEKLETIRIQMSASLSSVNQPNAISTLPPGYTGAGGAYTVLGNDDLPIPVAEWNNKGGDVVVSVDPTDSTYLLIDIYGMTSLNDNRTPYRVGVMSSGAGVYYPAMYIRGAGVGYDKKLLTVYTGAANTEQVIGVTIDDPTVSTLSQALTVIQKTVGRYSGANYTMSGDAVSINRAGSGNEFAGPKVQQEKEYYSGEPVQTQKLEWLGRTVDEWNQFWRARVVNNFENQLFGNASGSRVFQRNTAFRVTDATITETSVSFNAESDVIVGDHNKIWTGKKVSDYNTVWVGKKVRSHDLRPLRKI